MSSAVRPSALWSVHPMRRERLNWFLHSFVAAEEVQMSEL
jgi:hypothetical protein